MNEAPEKPSRRAFDTYSKQLFIVVSAATLRLVIDALGGPNAETIESLLWPLLALAIASSIYGVVRLVRARRGTLALRSETPDAFVALATRSMPKPQAASASAIAASLFGDRALAERVLGSIEWNVLPSTERAERLFAEAMIHAIDGDSDEAFSLARRAAAAADVSEQGKARSRDAVVYRTRLALHRMLAGAPTDATLAALEEGHARLRDLDRVLASWGLSLAYEAAGRSGDAARMRSAVRASVPHAQALLACVDAPRG